MQTLKEVLIGLGYSEEEAKDDIEDAREELDERIMNGEDPYDYCQERWGLEPDYLEELLP